MKTATPTPVRRSPLSEERSPGLCGTCARAASCTYRRDPSTPVVSCDEFDGLRDPLLGVVVRSAPPEGSARRNPVRGLCSTCDAFDGCTLPKTESGVWRCEEFR